LQEPCACPAASLFRLTDSGYIRRMSVHEQSLLSISQRLDRLLELCRTLQDENRSLRHSQEQLATERAQLLARNEQARSRVEAMIARLKSLEQHT